MRAGFSVRLSCSLHDQVVFHTERTRHAARAQSSDGLVGLVVHDPAETGAPKSPAPRPETLEGRIRRGHAGLHRLHERHVDDVLGDEPDLQLVAANHAADDQIVGAIVTDLGRTPGHRARLFQHDLVRMQQPRDLDGDFFAAFRRPRDRTKCPYGWNSCACCWVNGRARFRIASASITLLVMCVYPSSWHRRLFVRPEQDERQHAARSTATVRARG